MARLPRFVIPGQTQHIIQRGNNRQVIFAADADYRFFREALVEAASEFGLAIHAYVWMTNHIHLLATPNNGDGISKVLQSVGRRYVQYFNKTYRRSGTLWEGRYRATVVDREREKRGQRKGVRHDICYTFSVVSRDRATWPAFPVS